MNKWQILFLVLACLNITIILILTYLILKPNEHPPDIDSLERNKAEFIIHSNKSTLNNYLNEYIKKRGRPSPLPYRVVLEDDVKLTGHLSILNKKVDFLLTFDPQVDDNGNLLLHQNKMIIGQLELPVSTVLNYIKHNYTLPQWVTVYPKQKVIHLEISALQVNQHLNVKIEKFDLKNDEIIFSLNSAL